MDIGKGADYTWDYIGAEHHSNNTGELTGLHQAILRAKTRPRGTGREEICSDSTYAINMTTGKWMPRKERNQSIIRVLRKVWRQLEQRRPGEVRMRHVRSHVGTPGNEAADWLAGKGVVDLGDSTPPMTARDTTVETVKWLQTWIKAGETASTARSSSTPLHIHTTCRGSGYRSPASPHSLSGVAEPQGVG